MSTERVATSGSPSPDPSTKWAIARLALALAAIVTVFVLTGLSNLLIFIVALVLIVVVHELGHYVTAKWSRMKVTEFFIGFGPRLWSVRRGETEYGVKPILAGAYVKIPGMTNVDVVDARDEPRTYRRQPFRRRILVASAGSAMHFVLAFVLALVLVGAFGVPTASGVQVMGFVHWAGHARTAAQAAGIRTGERIVSVDGHVVSTPVQLATDIGARHGRAVRITVTRGGNRSAHTVQPQPGHKTTHTKTEVLGPSATPGKTDWLIGIETASARVFASKNPLQAIAWAGNDVGNVTRLTVVGIGRVFSPGGLSSLYSQVTNSQAATQAAKKPAASNRIASVVEIGRLATQAEAAGVYYFVSILIALNISLGLLNMLPMLPLDGGHVAIAVYERIRTRRGRPYYQADVTKLMPVAYAFMAVLLVIVGSAVFLDIAHPLANPFG